MKSLKKVLALLHPERDNFLYKFCHAFILHEGKENQEELITKALTRINY